MSSADDRMRARIKRYTDAGIIAAYGGVAKLFDKNPQHPDAGAWSIVMDRLDFELLARPHIECCDECSVPLAANYHMARLHRMAAGTAGGDLAEAMTNAAVAVATKR